MDLTYEMIVVLKIVILMAYFGEHMRCVWKNSILVIYMREIINFMPEMIWNEILDVNTPIVY